MEGSSLPTHKQNNIDINHTKLYLYLLNLSYSGYINHSNQLSARKLL